VEIETMDWRGTMREVGFAVQDTRTVNISSDCDYGLADRAKQEAAGGDCHKPLKASVATLLEDASIFSRLP
jgi:hypothetical protein